MAFHVGDVVRVLQTAATVDVHGHERRDTRGRIGLVAHGITAQQPDLVLIVFREPARGAFSIMLHHVADLELAPQEDVDRNVSPVFHRLLQTMAG